MARPTQVRDGLAAAGYGHLAHFLCRLIVLLLCRLTVLRWVFACVAIFAVSRQPLAQGAIGYAVDDASTIFAGELLAGLTDRSYKIAVAEIRSEGTGLLKEQARRIVDGLERALVRLVRNSGHSFYPRQNFETVVDELWQSGFYGDRLVLLRDAAKKAQVEVVIDGTLFVVGREIKVSFKALRIMEGGRILASTRELPVAVESNVSDGAKSDTGNVREHFVANIEVSVARTKGDGLPWDADGSGPEITICLESHDEGGSVSCYPPTVDWRMRPGCRNAYRCVFEGIKVPVGRFQVTVFDVGLVAHDMIGSGLCEIGAVCQVGQARISIMRTPIQR